MRGSCAAVIVSGLLALTESAHAQSPTAAPTTIPVGDWQLAPQLELRTRGEYRRDAPDIAVRNSYGVLQRTRLGLGAEYGTARGDPGFLRAQVTIQDARAWGVPAPSGILGAEGSAPSSIGIYEAWVEARTSSARPAFLRIGRQAVTWGDGRLLSNADWSPAARTLDAARGHVSAGVFDFELLAAILDTPQPLGPALGSTLGPASTGSELYGAQMGAALAPLLKLELSLLARVTHGTPPAEVTPLQGARVGETYVGSLRVFGDGRGWRYAVEGAYELGRETSLGDRSLSAWAAAGYVERKLDTVLLTPTLRLEADYASGRDGGATDKQFDPILPEVHELHGAMDLLAWSNTMQASARVTVVPWTEGRLAAEYRYARLANRSGPWLDGYLVPMALPAGQGTELGHEIDAWAAWRPWPVFEVVGGYSAFLLAATPAHFGYLQATLRVP